MEQLNYKGYKGSVEYSEEDKCFFGKVLDLAHTLILFEGDTKEDLKKDFEEAIEYHLAYECSEMDHSILAKNAPVNVRIPAYIHKQVATTEKKLQYS
ncbi:MAG: type II toxin-antitoxin system HicB family antitoxin [Bacteroidales bacterium]|nr:type II toxin-antitoxin system HicB family antitoxin [Bacteroidales bacterium]